METAKIFENGRSQAVRLPKKFRFNTDEVIVQQLGDAVILVPKESMWQTFYGRFEQLHRRYFRGWSRSGCSRGAGESVTYMLDTNICIYAMRNKPEQVLQRLKKGAEQRRLHFFHHACRTGVWNEA